jgi:hypothetical protein
LHQDCEPRCRRPARYRIVGGSDLSVTQYRHAVAERKHFLELVTDEYNRDALRPEPAQDLEQGGRFVAADRGGRLVQQEELRLQRERFGDLDNLHLRDRERHRLGPRVDGAIEEVEEAARLPVHFPIVDHAASSRQAFNQDVLADREARDEIAILMHRANPGGERFTWGGEFHRLIVKQQTSGIGLVDAGHDLDER